MTDTRSSRSLLHRYPVLPANTHTSSSLLLHRSITSSTAACCCPVDGAAVWIGC